MAKRNTKDIDEEKVTKDGFLAAAEGEDNAIAVSDSAFVGVSPEYANYGDDVNKPYAPEGEEGEIAKAFAKAEADRNTVAKPIHPSEVKASKAPESDDEGDDEGDDAEEEENKDELPGSPLGS